ncbi:LOW QUALITY PROTEIN: 43 kDa receptor-associated protein of the synapse homolog [Ctenocephalides felis]|uniref:LOW QUALITY PROTEIN: 43 kDa receptor-associated protein of the synapse homolog n=1 Tax=Ctenocephalides felis TaxID=7515 RepID=UPI000E6E194D|nr:LOW QUALITY PROTEIN: 43 kDa receptor-associated protein of the synapse homolog [Ctenocephalides felis]
MSWDSVSSREFLGGPPSHQLSATHLLASPDGSRHPLDTPNIGSSDFRNRSCFGNSGGSSIWSCFVACHRGLRQSLARRKISQGLKLYSEHREAAAVRVWRSALKNIRRRDDRFMLLGYLYRAHADWGKYRESLEYAHRQLSISEELDSPWMRAEAYINLATAHERMGALERALSYARHALYNDSERVEGAVQLTVARVYLEMGGYSRSLEGLHGALKLAQATRDHALELQVYVGFSELFGRLQDVDKSATYAAKAYDLSRSLQLGDLNSRDHRAALIQMASALRKQGDLGDAQDYCSEAIRLSIVSGDQATYTRALGVMGDIYRKKQDIGRAFRQYEQAMGASAAVGDRLAQMQAMDGAARCLEALRLQNKICNCRPLEFNTRLLEVASSVGAKLLVRTVRTRLSQIYTSLGDSDKALEHERAASELRIDCPGCGEDMGLEPEPLEALPCAHILHARCAHDILRRRDKRRTRACPACNKNLGSRLQLCQDEIFSIGASPPVVMSPPLITSANRSRLSLNADTLSLRASSLTMNSDCQATSSV